MNGPDNGLLWLLAASAVIWLGLGCYLAFLGLRQNALGKHIRQMENWRAESDS